MLTRLSGTSVPSVQSKVMPPSSRQKSFTVYSEQGGSRFVWNVGTFPQNYVTPGYRRRLYASIIKAEIIHTSTPNKEAAGSSETSAHFHKTMWHQDTEDVFMNCCQNLKFFMFHIHRKGVGWGGNSSSGSVWRNRFNPRNTFTRVQESWITAFGCGSPTGAWKPM